MMKKIKFITKNKTRFLLNRLFLPEKVIRSQKGPNCILIRSIVVVGGQSTGKTEFFKSMVNYANKRYGKENVNAMLSNGNPEQMLHRNITDHLIQLICVDDATQAFSTKNKDGRRQTKAFFQLRSYGKLAGMRRGLIVVFFNTHRFHGIPPEFRTESFYTVFKSLPTNPYDRNVVERYIGGNAIDDLREISQKREVSLAFNKYSICYSYDGKTSLLKLKMARVDNINEQTSDSDEAMRNILIEAGVDPDAKIL